MSRRIAFVNLIFILGLGTTAFAQNPVTVSPSPPPGTSAHVYREQDKDVPNLSKVDSFIYRGGAPTARGLSNLKNLGIATIVDLRGYSDEISDVMTDKAIAARLGMNFVHIPMTVEPDGEKLSLVLREMESAEIAKKLLYVHCKHGADRTGYVVAAWRIKHDAWNFDRAYKEMIRFSFNPEYQQLADAVKLMGRH